MWQYEDPGTGNKYYWNTTMANQATHQQACRKLGGHLISFESRQEQVGGGGDDGGGGQQQHQQSPAAAPEARRWIATLYELVP